MAEKSYITQRAAVKHLAVFYKNTAGDYVSREDLLIAAGKNPADNKDYQKWFGYMMTAMGEYELFTKVTGTLLSGQQGIIGITLTDKGRQALLRHTIKHEEVVRKIASNGGMAVEPPAPEKAITGNNLYVNNITISTVLRDVEKLRLQEPELDIVFDIKLKEKSPMNREG